MVTTQPLPKKKKNRRYATGLSLLSNVQWYITSNAIRNNNLQLLTITDLDEIHYKTFHAKLHSHPNPFIRNISSY